jgi:hypothetical protein
MRTNTQTGAQIAPVWVLTQYILSGILWVSEQKEITTMQSYKIEYTTATSLRGHRLTWEAYVDANGNVRWESNDRVPPAECVEMMFMLDMIDRQTMDESTITREQEQDAFFAEYRAMREREGYSIEHVMEARAELGADAVIVDVITGKTLPTLSEMGVK